MKIYKIRLSFVTVQPSDTGKYMVKAVNAGGEAQSIADFLVVDSQPDRMIEVTKTMVFSDLPQNNVKVSEFLIYLFSLYFILKYEITIYLKVRTS